MLSMPAILPPSWYQSCAVHLTNVCAPRALSTVARGGVGVPEEAVISLEFSFNWEKTYPQPFPSCCFEADNLSFWIE